MINIDLWYKDNIKESDNISVLFYPNDGEYRGNIYKNCKIIGDYSSNNSLEIERAFSHLVINWD